MAYVLDTDTLSALQRNHPAVVARVTALASTELFVTIITCEEQLAGRLHVLRGPLPPERLVEAYQRLQQTVRFFATVPILPFDPAAARRAEAFRQVYPRMGTRDRRIAAIAWEQRATLVTRNTRDFQGIGGLRLANWVDDGDERSSVPPSVGQSTPQCTPRTRSCPHTSDRRRPVLCHATAVAGRTTLPTGEGRHDIRGGEVGSLIQ